MADQQLEAEVAICGGGPVGLGLAIELGQRGVAVTVLERRAAPQPVPKGQNLTQRTMEHFRAWGIEDRLRAARTTADGAGSGGVTAWGTLLSGWHYDWLNRGLVGQYYAAANERLPQYRTEAVLRARLADLPSVRLLTGWTVDAAAQDADAVTLAAAGAKGRMTLRAAWAVGADGSRSTIRQAAGLTQSVSDHRREMMLLVFRAPALDRLLQRFPGKAFFSVLHPDFDGYWLFLGRVDDAGEYFFHAPLPEGADRETFDVAGFVQQAVGAEFALDVTYRGFWDCRVALADSYRAGRILIAGDAAHSHPPYGGYGINTGFEDARNLGWKLAAQVQGWAGPGLLDSYDAERRPVFASTARDFIEKAIAADRDFLAAFHPDRDRGAFAAEWARRAEGAAGEVGSFQPNYAGSPVVAGAGGASGAVAPHAFRPRPGFHLAPRRLADGRRATDLAGQGFTLLALGDGADAATLAAAAARRGVPLEVVRAPAGGEATAYGAARILVRPDGFVAWTGERVADAETLLAKVVGG